MAGGQAGGAVCCSSGAVCRGQNLEPFPQLPVAGGRRMMHPRLSAPTYRQAHPSIPDATTFTNLELASVSGERSKAYVWGCPTAYNMACISS
jgi:hypothetical protein